MARCCLVDSCPEAHPGHDERARRQPWLIAGRGVLRRGGKGRLRDAAPGDVLTRHSGSAFAGSVNRPTLSGR